MDRAATLSASFSGPATSAAKAKLPLSPPDFEAIRALVAEDLASLDKIVAERLTSPIALVGQVAAHIVGSGGKRLRPLVVLLAARALGAPRGKEHVEAAVLIEFIHTATLLHDDVVDHSLLRRGRKTANALFGNEASVLVGDFLYSRAFQIMAGLGKLPIMSIMADATNVIAEGEVLQLMNAQDPDTTEARYLEVIQRKTAKLFEAGARIAAQLNGAPANVQNALARYGQHLGTAFQLIDDVLDYRSDVAVRGKQLGEDLAEGKPTLPLIHAMQHGSAADKAMLRSAVQLESAPDLPRILECLERLGSIEYTRRRAEAESAEAVEALEALPPTVYRDALAQLARSAVSRQH